MTRFQGFETKEQAQDFIKKNGGILTTRVYTPKGRLQHSYKEYTFAVLFGGLDEKKYPYCVQWNERD